MNHPEILAAIVCIVFLAIAFVIECSRQVLKKRLQPGSRWAERHLIRSKTAAFREMRENIRLEAERANTEVVDPKIVRAIAEHESSFT